MTEFRFECFRASEHSDWYRGHLRLKYLTFVREGGWELPSDSEAELVLPDANDDNSIFGICWRGESVIGTVRASPCGECFPHREWFERHLQAAELQSLLNSLCTMNSLAVIPSWRGRHIRFARGRGTVAEELMVCVSDAAAHWWGSRGVLLSVVPDRSLGLMAKLGFYVLDGMLSTQERAGAGALVNLGALFNDWERFRQIGSPMAALAGSPMSQADVICREYFQRCESQELSRLQSGRVRRRNDVVRAKKEKERSVAARSGSSVRASGKGHAGR